tara:strand:- start:126 stop:401 length:276 start_codon:yes stop_codon:yes gene_type:complete
MIYENYTIERFDERNMTLEKVIAVVATRDNKLIGTKKGDNTTRTVFLGYHANVFIAIRAIVRDKAGVGCDDLNALTLQLETMLGELKPLCQ